MSASAPGTEVTHRRILAIAAPIILSNVTVPLLGAVDTGVVGQLGQPAAIGAVGLGAVTLATFYWVFGFLRMGTTGLVAQARGAGRPDEVAAGLWRALAIGLGAGLVLVLLQPLLIALALTVAPGGEEVEALARAYLSIRLWGAPATIALYAINGWLIAMERTRAVLILQLVINGLNLGLDLWFVLGLGWGVPGVAAATLIAEWTGLALGLWFCRAALGAGRPRGLWDPVALRRLWAVNGDILVRSVALQGAFTAFVFLGAGMGDVRLAANQVLMQFLEITAYALDGFAFAAETLVGLAVGAGARARFWQAARLAAIWGGAGAVALGAAFLILGGGFIDLLATDPGVRAEARAYVPWLALAPILGVASWILDGIFIGATWTGAMRRAMLQSVAIYGVAVAVLVPAFGNHGLWAALMVLNLTRALTLGLRLPGLARGIGDYSQSARPVPRAASTDA